MHLRTGAKGVVLLGFAPVLLTGCGGDGHGTGSRSSGGAGVQAGRGSGGGGVAGRAGGRGGEGGTSGIHDGAGAAAGLDGSIGGGGSGTSGSAGASGQGATGGHGGGSGGVATGANGGGAGVAAGANGGGSGVGGALPSGEGGAGGVEEAGGADAGATSAEGGGAPAAGTGNVAGGPGGLGGGGSGGGLSSGGAGGFAGGAGVAGSTNACAPLAPLGGADDASCTGPSDCDVKLGRHGCGVWSCNAGRCEVATRCDDLDGDGFGVGPDCACIGKPVDCDDGDPATGATASASCCNGGTRACTGGTWGLCSTATGETCDGVDNDCNGAIDDLGEFSCGIGACRKTVPACTGGKLGVCVPDPPATTFDGCNGIDDDCDGAVDEDCGKCLHVALDGDDTLAANDPTKSFKSVQAAIDFADAHREFAAQICVAAGPACGATATFPGPSGDLTMREGLSVLANYESTCWTRCTTSTTHLAPTTARGVLFPTNIEVETTLDGFTIDRPYDATASAGVTVDGARGVVLANLTVPYDGTAQYSPGTVDGVDLVHGAQATIVGGILEGGKAAGNAGVRAVDSTVSIEDTCGSFDATTGRCTSACASAVPHVGAAPVGLQAGEYAVVLDGASGSRIERSTICAYEGTDSSNVAAAVRVDGVSSDVTIRANTIGAEAYGTFYDHVLLALEECGGDAPWIVDNERLDATSHGGGSFTLLRATGNCHPVIESNKSISVTGPAANNGTVAIRCRAGQGPSRCVIANDSVLGLDWTQTEATNTSGTWVSSGLGIDCAGASCARIENNTVTGIKSHGSCQYCSTNGSGLSLSGGAVTVTNNSVTIGSSASYNFYGYSVQGSTTGNVTHNSFGGSYQGSAPLFEANQVSATQCGSFSACPAMAWAGGGTVRGNCFVGSGNVARNPLSSPITAPAFYESGTSADPLVFQDNGLFVGQGWFSTPAAYVDEGTTALSTADQVNALTDMTVSGTTVGSCPPMQ